MSRHTESWTNVNVLYDIESGSLDIRDSNDNDKQLGLFYVMEEN